MFSQIVQKTPSIYFKFDDSYQKHNFSKSSLAFEYSVTNQKYLQGVNLLQSQRHHNHENLDQNQNNFVFRHNKNINGISCANQTRNNQVVETCQFNTKNNMNSLSKKKQQFRCAPFLLYYHDQQLQNLSSKLKTQQFFEQFQSNYVVTFEQEQRIFGENSDFSAQQEEQHHELFTQDQYLSDKGPSILNFDFEERVKMIHIQSKKSLKRIQETYEKDFKNQQQLINEQEHQIQKKWEQQINIGSSFSNESYQLKKQLYQQQQKQIEMEIDTKDQQYNNKRDRETYVPFSFNQNLCQIDRIFNGIQKFNNNFVLEKNAQNNDKNIQKAKAKSPKIFNINFNHLQTNKNNSIITKDFQNNSNIFQMNPQSTNRKRVPLRNIGNILNNNLSGNGFKQHSKNQKSTKGSKGSKNMKSQTRKKQIINGDLFISTINKNNVWTNPIQKKQSEYFSSLERCFSWQKKDENLFKTTNAFKQTLKSTTLQNWKKKYHMKNMYEKKTTKRNINIFQKPFMVR